MANTKMECDGCKRMIRTNSVVFFHGKRLCKYCLRDHSRKMRDIIENYLKDL